MATAIFVHDGKAIDYTPTVDLPAGAVVVQGDLIGVTRTPIAANTLGSLAVEDVFDFPKATGTGKAIAAGVNCYWDAAEAVAKADSESGANKLIGKSVKAATDPDDSVRIRMSQ